ncbi:TPA: hypothetical protein JBA24_12890 [Legionella pneumophila]|uniref:restriction endonuclease n=1 Tax=Legionella pneumophila TaxID=446 RepID=UPI001374F42B|nr:restriction endonuclease [Legionella pneumophila]HCC3246214.1 restriction endonuclease [Legionella pneumophila subsp. pneumophila]MCZ4805738.1 restriction endonuclease [Legionella pneumophila]MDW9181013.1 restriction endonuclease [Legionella pneumophila]HAT1825407.1 hypothetical protein [Legionella pneumophila]HAT1866120.1 hypothetical protein [Legionella pneumophila]
MKIFSPALKGQIKACILALIWPREEIFKFFKDLQCPTNVLKSIEKWQDQNMTRADMVKNAFQTLEDQHDNGTLYFNLMLETLTCWTYFDDYWFKTQKKLSLIDAKKKIADLKAAKDNVIDTARKRASEQKKKTEDIENTYASLEEMKNDFRLVSMSSETAQKRGLVFEKFLTKMAKFYSLKATEAFKTKGTQIDGTIKYDGENYLIEAKWHSQCLSDEPLMAFCHKQEMNMHGRGIFISVNGITSGCLAMLEKSSIKNTIVMDGEDITLILEGLITLPEVLEKKIHAAQTRGKFYINPITGLSKIKS